jgi:hypothetical protein
MQPTFTAIEHVNATTSKATVRTQTVLIDRSVAKGGFDLGPAGGEYLLVSLGDHFTSHLLAAIRARETAITNVRVRLPNKRAPGSCPTTRARCAISAVTARRPRGMVRRHAVSWVAETCPRTPTAAPSTCLIEIERVPAGASNSPILSPLAAISSTIVRYGSSSGVTKFAKRWPEIIAGLSFKPFCRLIPPRVQCGHDANRIARLNRRSCRIRPDGDR